MLVGLLMSLMKGQMSSFSSWGIAACFGYANSQIRLWLLRKSCASIPCWMLCTVHIGATLTLAKAYSRSLLRILDVFLYLSKHEPGSTVIARVPVKSNKFWGPNIFPDTLYTSICACYYTSTLCNQTFQRHSVHIGSCLGLFLLSREGVALWG